MKKILNKIKENKSYIFPWVVLIGLVVVLASGLTYAYFDFVADEEGESSMRITATNLNISLSITNVNLTNLMPIYDDYKDSQANAFNFTMSNTSRKLSGCVDLFLGITNITEGLGNSDFKWELKNNTTNTVTTGNFSNIIDGKLLLKANETIAYGTTYSYTLRIWYSYKDKFDQNVAQGASLTSTLLSVAYGGACASTATIYSEVGTIQFVAPEDGYYRIQTYNVNGDYASGEIMLADNEKLYLTVSDTAGTPSSVKCYIDETTGLCGTIGSQNEDNSRIMYAKNDLSHSFISGYAGVNAPIYVNNSTDLSYNTIHPTGKFFLNGRLSFSTSDTIPKIIVTYLGKYQNRNTNFDNVRYVKDCINGNTVDTSNYWIEIQAMKNGVNIAYNKSINVTGTLDTNNGTGSANTIVDGIIAGAKYTKVSSGNQCATIDLGRSYDLDEVAVWHYYSDGRKFHNNIISVSTDNSNWTQIRNETTAGESLETPLGKRVSAYSDYSRSIIKRMGTDSTMGLPVVRIGTEDFYDLTNAINYSSLNSTFLTKINYDASKSILLAKYNLYVGQNCTSSSSCTPISTSDSRYGLQSEDAKGYVSSSSMIAVVPFSGSSNDYGYWDPSNSGINSKYGTYTSYANNIYDTEYVTAPNYSVAFTNNAGNANYSIAYYVEEYINTLGIEGTGRLLTYLEANAMTPTQRTNGARYWLGSASSYDSVRYMGSGGGMSNNRFYLVYYNGVRPVIIVDTSDITE